MKKKTLILVLAGTAGTIGVILWRRSHGTGGTVTTDLPVTDPTVPTDGSFSLGPSDLGSDPFGGAQSGSGGAVVEAPDVPGPRFGSNAEWAVAAEGDLGGNANVAAAINKVLGGVPVTSAEKNIFGEALGLEGPPPNPYPPVHLVDTPGQPKPPVKQYVTAQGFTDLYKFAVQHHLTETQLVHLNPNLAHLVGTGKHIPKGTKVRIK
jgi:LysM repeat protein